MLSIMHYGIVNKYHNTIIAIVLYNNVKNILIFIIILFHSFAHFNNWSYFNTLIASHGI